MEEVNEGTSDGWRKGDFLSTSFEGSVVSCEIESQYYEEVVNRFKESSVLVHFLGKPPCEADLKLWLKGVWSDKGWGLDSVKISRERIFCSDL